MLLFIFLIMNAVLQPVLRKSSFIAFFSIIALLFLATLVRVVDTLYTNCVHFLFIRINTHSFHSLFLSIRLNNHVSIFLSSHHCFKRHLLLSHVSLIMAKIVKLSSLRIGETFVLLPSEVKSILGEGATIYNFTPPMEYYIFDFIDSSNQSCFVYHYIPETSSKSSECLPCVFLFDILVIKF